MGCLSLHALTSNKFLELLCCRPTTAATFFLAQFWKFSEAFHHTHHMLPGSHSCGDEPSSRVMSLCLAWGLVIASIDWYCFYYFVRNSLVALLEALCAWSHTKWAIYLKGGPEPLENKVNEIFGLKREYRCSNPFCELVQKSCLVCFSYLLRLSNFCKALRDMRKFPQKCQKIAGRWWRAVYASDLRSPPNQAHPLRNDPVQTSMMSQPWSDTICSRTIASSTLFCPF